VSHEKRPRDAHGVDEFERVAAERRELAAAEGLGVEESRRAVAAQCGREHAPSFACQRFGHLAPRLGAIRPAVQQDRGARALRIPFEVSDLELRGARECVRGLGHRRTS
jgi:hypothetical protein